MQEIHKVTQYTALKYNRASGECVILFNLSLNIPCRDLGHLVVLEELPLCRVLDMCGALKPAERFYQ